MHTIPAPLQAHIAGEVTSLTVCWAVTRQDGVVVRGTQCDRDVVITTGALAGTYLSTSGITASTVRAGGDLSPDNSEIDGVQDPDSFITGLTAADIEAGLFDDAALKVFLCNWAAPDGGQVQLPGAYLGNIRRTSEGRYTAEVRGLAQRLTQPLLRTCSDTCNAELGDARCGVDPSALIVAATVSAVTSRRLFTCSLAVDSSSGVAGDYIFGKLVGVTGLNAGYTREIKQDAVGAVFGSIALHEPMPAAVQVGDTFAMHPGCNKEKDTDCKLRFNNVLRFRGFGVFTPGAYKMLRGPARGSGPV